MKKLNLLAAITVACSALISGLQAAPITYSLVNNAALQNGYTLSGSITTDGTIGVLSDSNITGWAWTVTNTATSAVTFSESGTSVMSNRIVASATQFTLPQANLDVSFLRINTSGGFIRWDRYPENDMGMGMPGMTFPALDGYMAAGNGVFFWDQYSVNVPLTSTSDGSWIIAEASTSTIPEPSTYGLLFGGFTLAVVAMRRRTSKQA